MNLERTMKQAGFTWDPTGLGRDRWTHFALEITCLRQPYMTEAQWEAEQQRCAKRAQEKSNAQGKESKP